MTPRDRESATAALNDLEAALASIDGSEESRLRKISIFSSTALALRQEMSDADQDWLNAALHKAAHGHDLPDDCVLPEGTLTNDR